MSAPGGKSVDKEAMLALLRDTGFDTDDLASSFEQAGASIAAPPTESVAPFLPPEMALAAATRGAFLPSDLGWQESDGGDAATLDALLREADPVVVGSERAWQLRPETRRRVLLQAQQEQRLQPALDAIVVSSPQRDAQGSILRKVLGGWQPEMAALTIEELTQLETVSQWLGETSLAALPSPDALRQAIAQRELLEPFRILVGRTVSAGSDGSGDRFVGREREMERLRAYVGIVPPEQLGFMLQRAASSLWSTLTFSDAANEPLLLQGGGGMGKSTLLAKFVLDHALFPGVSLPFAYLDFDRATLAPRQPFQLLIDIALQLGIQFAALEPDLKRLRADLRAIIDRQTQDQERTALESTTGSTLQDCCARLRDCIERMNQGRAPVLLLFDTFEVVQYDQEAVTGVAALIAELRSPYGTPWANLRIVVSGRAEMPEIRTSHEPIVLGRLSIAATRQLLQRRNDGDLGLKAADIAVLAKPLSNSPLDVVLITNWLKDREPAEREALVRDMVKEVAAKAPDADAGEGALGSRLVTGILVGRMIEHITHKDARKLANPGLVVRAVTVDLIRHVMAPACGLAAEGEMSDELAASLFDELAREKWLVTRRGNALVHRPEVRQAMLALMRRQGGGQAFLAANRHAVSRFGEQLRLAPDNAEIRAEYLYHLMLGGETPIEEIDKSWSQPAGRLLSNAVDELGGLSHAYLRARLGRNVSIETLQSLPLGLTAELLVSFGRRLLGRSVVDGIRTILTLGSKLEGSMNPQLLALRYEALYRGGRWEDLRLTARGASASEHERSLLARLWRGDFAALASLEEADRVALKHLCRWAARDPSAERIWREQVAILCSNLTAPEAAFEVADIACDMTVFLTLAGARGMTVAAAAAERLTAALAGMCRANRRLPEAATSTHILRVLANFEPGPERPLLRRVDFEGAFATVSSREIGLFCDTFAPAVIRAAAARPSQQTKGGTGFPTRIEVLVGKLRELPQGNVIADSDVTREFAKMVATAIDLESDDVARSVLQLLALRAPDWLEPLGHSLTQAFDGEVPSKIGWWSSIDKYLGSGKQRRSGKRASDGLSILALADEAASLPEAVDAYLKLATGEKRPNARDFIAVANAYRQWTELVQRRHAVVAA